MDMSDGSGESDGAVPGPAELVALGSGGAGLEAAVLLPGAGEGVGVGPHADGEAGDEAAGVGAPVRGAEAGVGGDQHDAAAVVDAAGEGLDLAGAGEDAETVAEPLNDGARHERAALEAIRGALTDLPADGGQE